MSKEKTKTEAPKGKADRWARFLVKKGNTYEVRRVRVQPEASEVEFSENLRGINLGKMERQSVIEAQTTEGK